MFLIGRGRSARETYPDSSRFSGVGVGIIIVPSVAALAAVNASGLQTGTIAFVQSVGAYWELDTGLAAPAANSATECSALIAATPGVGAWQRFASGIAVKAVAQATWYVDPIGGNDEASGADAAHPIQHKAEIFRRWGYTWSPVLTQNTTVIPLRSQASDDASDPSLFQPITENCRFLLQPPLPATPAYAGTLTGVTAKNRATNTPLSTKFTGDTTAIAIGQLIVNTTRGNSRAIVVEELDVVQGIHLISQPLTPYDITTFPTSQTEVDTWADGDSVLLYDLVKVDIPLVGGTVASYANDLGSSVVVSQVDIIDPLGTSASCAVELEAAPLFVDCFSRRTWSVAGANTTQSAYFLGCMSLLSAFFNANTFNGVFLTGGAYDTIAAPCGLGIDNDTIVLTSLTVGTSSLVNVYLSTDSNWVVLGGASTVPTGSVYGSYIVNVLSGDLVYAAPATTSLVGVKTSNQLFIGSSNQAYSNATAAGVTSVHRLAMTLASLGAAAGAAGFGDLAYIPGVGAISVTASAP